MISGARIRIVLDANVICGDPWLQGNESRVFFEGARIISSRVYVPRVALEEAVNFQVERLRNLHRDVQRAEAAWRRASRIPREVPSSDDVLMAAERGYQEYLSRVLAEQGVEILSYPHVRHEDLVRRALERRRPFSQAGGYRDTLIWVSVLDLLRTDPTPVWFATQNEKDFGPGPVPLSDLVSDLVAIGLTGEAVRIYPSLAKLNEEQVTPHLKRLETRELGFSLDTWAKETLAESLLDARWTKALVDLEPGHVEISGLRILKVLEFGVDDLRLLPSGDTLVTAHAVVDMDFSVATDEKLYLIHEDVRAYFPSATLPFGHMSFGAQVIALVAVKLILRSGGSKPLSWDIEGVQVRSGITPGGSFRR